ncbi:hypothetical protein SEA_FAUST_219 [Streptomyces phage Faust]|uniref:Uncharacterized protein n=1 Tax=Streptomyces phage Faust TaxID=2767565 RepID=A0A7G9UZ36_9CAUD|nr:hypothetical protein PP456_gp068 [Streptomyces phage Faust]QNN99291.1 hypothetical protein SEA_FAUST_219 [Streptomyces phage Faust]
MATGFENSSEDTMRVLIGNLKSGTFLAIEKVDSAAFELDMTLLSIFEAEYIRRGLDFDSLIGDKLRGIMDNWKNERT